MTTFNTAAFAAEYRRRLGSLPADKFNDIIAAIEVGLGTRKPSNATPNPAPTLVVNSDPPWMVEARKHIGKSEIPGPKHSAFVVAMWKLLGLPFADDETPWCGGFVGFVLKTVGLPVVAKPAWARSWAAWGKPCDRALGAVAVFSRGSGGHVGFLAGVSKDGKLLYILGGNQRDQVNIMPLDAGRLLALRWPAHLPVGPKAPVMSGGVVSTNEA